MLLLGITHKTSGSGFGGIVFIIVNFTFGTAFLPFQEVPNDRVLHILRGQPLFVGNHGLLLTHYFLCNFGDLNGSLGVITSKQILFEGIIFQEGFI